MPNRTKQFTTDKANLKIIGLIAFLFLISANLAWLNPNKGDHVIKTHPNIPLFWQYGGDSTQEFLSAAFFPEYFATDRTRMNRPGYPALIKAIGLAATLSLRPFLAVDPLMVGLAGYVLLKMMVFTVSALLLYKVFLRWFEPGVAWLGVAIAFLNPYSIYYLSQFHTAELQFISPIFIVCLFMQLADRYSWQRNILYSLAVGALMLMKPNYAAYFAILFFSAVILKKPKAAGLSFAVHFLPFLAWLAVLKAKGIEYYNFDVQIHGQVVWLFNDLIFRPFFEIIKVGAGYVQTWLVLLVRHYSVFIFLAIASFIYFWKDLKYNRQVLWFTAFLAFFNWVQLLASKRINQSYMTADLSIIVYGLAAWLIWHLLMRYKKEKYLGIIFGFYLLFSLLSLAVFPWVHPYGQKNVLDKKMDRVDIYRSGQMIDKGY